ncbi:hypothetical protein J1614_002372 [Plenodomus biglobosus]|nr:hypothetical protein J1614_002372 [Plenodomus biglobosus]
MMPDGGQNVAVEHNIVAGTQKTAVNERNNNKNKYYSLSNEHRNSITGNNGWSQRLHLPSEPWKAIAVLSLVIGLAIIAIVVVVVVVVVVVKQSSNAEGSDQDSSISPTINLEAKSPSSDHPSISQDTLKAPKYCSSVQSLTPAHPVSTTSPESRSIKTLDVAPPTSNQHPITNPPIPTAFTTIPVLTAGASCTAHNQCSDHNCYTNSKSNVQFCCGPTIWGCPGFNCAEHSSNDCLDPYPCVVVGTTSTCQSI